MEDVLTRLEDELILLCIQVIDMLDRLKAAGILSEEEYQKHMREKQAFLDKRFHQELSK
ncbi:hypothetical protein [Anaerosolibacter sp.]|uniref:hypothetical protein n=1 Tax=Anaerosolibacter sp. TaxID=1872527 RepID=UPI0039F111BE